MKIHFISLPSVLSCIHAHLTPTHLTRTHIAVCGLGILIYKNTSSHPPPSELHEYTDLSAGTRFPRVKMYTEITFAISPSL